MRSEPGTFLIVQAGHATVMLGVLARDSVAGGGRAGYAAALTGPGSEPGRGRLSRIEGLRSRAREPGRGYDVLRSATFRRGACVRLGFVACLAYHDM